ncbi:MAG: glycosyltransferase family 4 protein [Oscillospiraceae bacterium]|nr:glycosyltransferase family 4 protein [Oscillospiraceae bacterium]
MKKILLISNYVFHYRQKNYNYFAERFARDGYEFHVLANEFQDVGYPFRFRAYSLPFSVKGYTQKIREIGPDFVILFLHLKDRIEIPVMRWCLKNNIPVIFWNKGVSSTDPHNPLKNALYHYIHNRCSALITYTPEMISNFRGKNRGKLFVAYNTVDCHDVDRSKYDRTTLREKYGIRESKVVLYVSRMRKDKRIEVLLDAMANQPDVAVAAMGDGMTPELQAKFDTAPNLYYLGQRYGEEGSEVWAMGDVFSVPVNVGLGINEALFWGMPVVTMRGFQPPEIYYLKEGKTGYVAFDESDYKEKLLALLNDEKKLAEMKKACEKEYETEASIDRMYQGFIDAVRYCERQI